NINQPLDDHTDINLRILALIPDDYLPDVHSRLVMYKRIAGAETTDALRELQVEMIDRFGLLPEPVKNLMRVTEIKLRAAAIGISKLELGNNGGRIEFAAETSIDPLQIVRLVQNHPQHYRLDGASALKLTIALADAETRLAHTDELLRQLSPAVNKKTG
ncbi:MAG TPA: TRCF domain-containing protein, partial [Cellvibrionaceae bacterium]